MKPQREHKKSALHAASIWTNVRVTILLVAPAGVKLLKLGATMQTILDEFRRYMKLARTAATTAVSDEYRRGYLPGLRRHYRVGQFPTQDEHAQCLRLADNPEYAEVVRGYRDGFAGIEPQP